MGGRWTPNPGAVVQILTDAAAGAPRL